MNFSTAFDEAIILDKQEDEQSFIAHTTPAYQNMIGPFGGITAAVLLAAVSKREDIQGQPLAITVNYIKVVAQGEYTIHTQLIGQSRTTQHFSLIAMQHDKIVLQGLALFGTLRAITRQTETPFPQVDDPEVFEPEDLILPWSKNYEFRFIQGGLREMMQRHSGLSKASAEFSTIPASDFSTENNTETLSWLRNIPPRKLDFPALAAISDSFIPRGMLRYRQMIPIGTVSLTTYFHASSKILQDIGEDYVLTQARAINFGEGWYDHIGYIWSRTGTLLATTTQMVYFKPPA